MYKTLAATALLASASLAAPLAARDGAQWTIEAFTRNCDDADTSCTYAFGIDTHTAPATPCTVSVQGSPASQASTYAVCGAYTVTSNWSGQFGPGNGFTTFAVTDQQSIIFPAYTDAEVQNGIAVSPDKSYTPQATS